MICSASIRKRGDPVGAVNEISPECMRRDGPVQCMFRTSWTMGSRVTAFHTSRSRLERDSGRLTCVASEFAF